MHRHLGVSLMEVLVSLFILSLLLLGFDAIQLTALRQTKIAYYMSVATEQLQGMSERLRMLNGLDATPQQMLWNHQNSIALPMGRGRVEGVYPTYSLSIFWGSNTDRECQNNKIGQSGCLHMLITI